MNNTKEQFLLQWNTRSVVSHWAEFKQYIINKKPLIAAIQETYFLDSDAYNYNFNIRGYSLYWNNVNSKPRRGGSALYISNKLIHTQIKYNSPLNYVAATVKIAQRDINVVSIYLSPSEEFNEQQLDNFVQQIPSPKIIIGDFNAQHRAWGCDTDTTRGTRLLKVTDKHDLICINNSTPTCYTLRQGKQILSVIDLAFVSQDIVTMFTSHVQIDTYFSDHFPIHINVETLTHTNPTRIPKWNLRKADWDSFREHVDTCINNSRSTISNTSNIRNTQDTISNTSNVSNTQVNISNSNVSDTDPMTTFLNTVRVAAETNIPKTRENPEYKHAPWWNIECQHAIAKRRRALRRCRKCPCIKHEKELREAQRNTKAVIQEAKKNGWETFSSNFNRFTPLSKIWSMIKCFKNKHTPTYKLPYLVINNQHFSQPKEVATQFALHFASISSHNNYTSTQHNSLDNIIQTHIDIPDAVDHYNHLFTEYELKLAITKCGNTSVGPDDLAYPFFKQLSQQSITEFLKLINSLWVNGDFPNEWRESILIPIIKKNKIQTDPASFRPISLSSCASKIVERMVNNRIRVYLEANNILSKHQNGFRPAHSTADNILHIIDNIQHAFLNNQVVAALFLDLKAAFDKVHHTALKIKLKQVGIQGRMYTYISNFLQNRSIKVRIGNEYSDNVAMEHGVPQGSPLSPTLFLILINDVFQNINNATFNIKYSMYADDLAIWTCHHSVDQAAHRLQIAVNEISKWCNKWGVQIAPNKSATMTFSHQQKHIKPRIPISINGEIIPIVNHFKYLGITLDRRLTFAEHINDLIQRCARRINIIKCIAGTDWGADRRTLARLYTSLIRSVLDYNAFLLINISNTLVTKLETIQNASLRIITGALKTTPIMNLQIDANFPSLQRRREYQLLRFYGKSLSRPRTTSFEIFTNLPTEEMITHRQFKYPTIRLKIKQLLRDLKISPPNLTQTPPLREFWMLPDIDTEILFDDNKKDITKQEILNIFHQYKEEYNHFEYIYTDGSKSEEKTGAAFYHRGFSQSFRLSNLHSVYSAELHAISLALSYCINKKFQQAIICTDSNSATQALAQKHNNAHPTVHQINNKIQQITNMGKTIKILWIPGHVGIHGNEKADEAAKLSLQNPERNNIPIPLNDFLSLIHEKHLQSVQFDWDVNPHPFLHPIKPKAQYWPSTNQNTRRKETILARLRTGHTRLTHSYITDGETPTACQTCNRRYNVKHVLLHCPQYDGARQKLIRHANAKHETFNLQFILGDCQENIELLFSFLEETKLEHFI